MTLLYMNGYEQYSTQADIDADSLHTSTTGTMSLVADGDFHGAQTLQMRGGGDSNQIVFPISANTSKTLHLGMDWKTSQPSGGHGHFNVLDSLGNLLVRSRTTGLRRLQLLNGAGVEIMNESGYLPSNEDGDPHHVSVSVTCDKTNGSYSYYFDDVLIASATGIDTSNAASPDDIGKVVYYFANLSLDTHYSWYDNYHVTNGIGPAPYNTRLGRVGIFDIVPISDSAVQFTPSTGIDNYATVDQLSGASEDYNASVTQGHEDLYGYSDLPATGDAVLAVQHMARVVDDINAVTEVALHTNTGANSNESASIVADNLDIKYGEILQYQDGVSDPWTESAVNAIIAGIKVV